MPRTPAQAARAKKARLQLGLTARQATALSRIQALKDRFAQQASYMAIEEMTKIAEECEALVRAHFPHEQKGEARPLAV